MRENRRKKCQIETEVSDILYKDRRVNEKIAVSGNRDRNRSGTWGGRKSERERERGRISELCESMLRISSVRMRRREIESKKSQRRAH